MAVRSGAGQGVIIALVLFLIFSFVGLAFSIIFYADAQEALKNEEQANDKLDIYARAAERSGDRFQEFEQLAIDRNQSVTTYLNNRYRSLSGFTGSERPTLDEIKSDFARYGVDASSTIRDSLEDKQRQIRAQESEIESLKSLLQSRELSLAALEDQLSDFRISHQLEVDAVIDEISAYRGESERYGQDVRDTIDRMNRSVDQLRDNFNDRVSSLETEIDEIGQENVLLKNRNSEYKAIFAEARIRSASPDLLVDAEVIDTDAGNDLIFINRGQEQRIVLGMTFEIYDDAFAIKVNDDNILPRGKASVQVVQIGPNTSTCKVTRSIPGRPIERGDVGANAVYDPGRRFKFLIHGRFDVDQDGWPSDAEAGYLRSMVMKWGGEVVEGKDLPGDLDFLVLGQEPPMPPPIRPDATTSQIEIWSRKKNARSEYKELQSQAREAQIPILNANRFYILTGYGGR